MPSSTPTVSFWQFVATTSGLPSPFKSATATNLEKSLPLSLLVPPQYIPPESYATAGRKKGELEPIGTAPCRFVCERPVEKRPGCGINGTTPCAEPGAPNWANSAFAFPVGRPAPVTCARTATAIKRVRTPTKRATTLGRDLRLGLRISKRPPSQTKTGQSSRSITRYERSDLDSGPKIRIVTDKVIAGGAEI